MAEEQDLYAILGVTPSAAQSEIEDAYRKRKSSGSVAGQGLWELEGAYAKLSNPAVRRAYDAKRATRAAKASASAEAMTGTLRQAVREAVRDAAEPPPRPPRAAMDPARARALVLGLGLVLVACIWLFVRPHLGWRFQTYTQGTKLVDKQSGALWGEVLEYRSHHTFANGVTLPAYRIRREGQSEERWYNKEEVNQLAKPQ